MLGPRTFQRPDGPVASTSMAPHGFPPLGDVGGVAAPEILDGALAVCRQECAQLADVLFEGSCLLSSSSCSWPCVAGRNPGDAPRSSSASRSAASDRMPCRRARCQGVMAEDRCLEPFPALSGVPPCRVRPRRGRLPASHHTCQGVALGGGASTFGWHPPALVRGAGWPVEPCVAPTRGPGPPHQGLVLRARARESGRHRAARLPAAQLGSAWRRFGCRACPSIAGRGRLVASGTLPSGPPARALGRRGAPLLATLLASLPWRCPSAGPGAGGRGVRPPVAP